MQNKKRILSVTVRQIVDDSPDTSYLGEYSNSPKSEYAIDRAHSEDCASLNPGNEEGSEWLDRIQSAICDNLPNDRELQPHGNFYLQEEMDACETLRVCRESMECDCNGGDIGRNEFRYFNPNHEKYKGLPEEEIRKYCRQDYDRMESLNRGDWCYLGIRADAEIGVGDFAKYPKKFNCTIQRITSGGLWGVESNSDESYLESVEKEELQDLRGQLKALGFSSRAISKAFQNVSKNRETGVFTCE